MCVNIVIFSVKMGLPMCETPAFFYVYFVFFFAYSAVLCDDFPQILSISAKGELGGEAQISCSLLPLNATAEWLFRGQPVKTDSRIIQTNEEKALQEKDLDGNVRKYKISNLTITNATSSDTGNYTCISNLAGQKTEYAVNLDLSFPAKLLRKTEGPIRINATDSNDITLECVFEIYNASEVKWWKRGKERDILDLTTKPLKPINLKHYETSYKFHIRRPEDNGTYICETWDEISLKPVLGETDVIVFAAPKVIIDTVKAISATQIYLNWTVHAYNLPIRGYNLMYRKLPSSDFNQYTKEKIGIKNTSFVLEGLDNSTEYQIKLEVATGYGSSTPYIYPQIVKTLDKNPVFVPNISINGFSATSVTIGWAPPPEDIAEFIHYYLLEARRVDENASKRAYHSRDSRNLPYMFDDLEPYSTYLFRVCACSEFTKKCGNWSEEMKAVTLDGTPGRPANVTLHCYVNEDRRRVMNLTWEPPVKPNAEIKGYSLELTGNTTYVDHAGNTRLDTWGPQSKSFTNVSRGTRIDDLKPNMNYTVKLSAMTRTRKRGEEQTKYCYTAPSAPDMPPRPHWRKIVENDRYMFKTYIPRISERNGPICCYRVFMVRLLPHFDWKDLPPPKDINVISYEDAHSVLPALGAYVTDLFSNTRFPPGSELIMGDEGSYYDQNVCPKCLKKPKRPYHEMPTPPTSTASTVKDDDYDMIEEESTAEPVVEERQRRSYEYGRPRKMPPPHYLLTDVFDPMMMDASPPQTEADEDIQVKDGPLDPKSNYTLFVELIPDVENEEAMYSEYLHVLMPAPSPPVAKPYNVLEIVLQVTCGILALVLLIMISFCIMHTRKARKLPPNAHIESNPLQAAFRYVEHVLTGGRQGTVAAMPHIPPIPKEELPAAYAERQADSDYGFQKEFEMLPDCFPDRTTHASEMRENQPKNRYPDIKAYDQTRVKLTQIDGIVGSDYINANYVMGYRERKQYICAQGPTDTTVNDFWRMIWEQRVDLVVMLTNLEEYSKVKCSRYWPEDVRGSKCFGGVSVVNVEEKRYSDYIVRELRISKPPTNAEGQPVVDNNGVAKRNGDCLSSPPLSPREKTGNGSCIQSRTVWQYHFLQWKDFAAPEHAHSILKFIKRVNSAWSQLSPRPCVIHCSAGVGRTGTLVALDYLLEQLNNESQVSVYPTVAELRGQRSFLVQSLKQYIFVYRALVDYAHYGDTEISASSLKTAIDTLRNTPEGADKCLMEHEFEKLLTSPVAEPVKSCSAASAEEVRCKNRSQDCLPYDRNRVILSPIPGKDFSTYINASFIEGYDNQDNFIITQDPMPNTIADFWRMVHEHNVTMIVMLSEIGEGDRKCPRYWDDGSVQYDHITVEYTESESLPYYTRRQFTVTNTKSGCSSKVTALQYHGWPTSGCVPEVTRGVGELATAAMRDRGQALVHANNGTERAPLFVALCILISQLTRERRIDVSCVARNIRALRAHTIDTFIQYEFLYRAILNYAELHNLMEDS